MSGTAVALAILHSVALGSEFTVRWAGERDDHLGGQVSLHEPCSSYECGLALLNDAPASRAAFVGSFEAATLFRGEAPDGDGWWAVVEGGDRMPMAMLWRPPTAWGHLPAVPVVRSAGCAVVARDLNNVPIEGAIVVRVLTEATANRSATIDGQGEYELEPSVLGAWLPWSPPGRTNAAGRAVIRVPLDPISEIVAGRVGYQSGRATCSAGGSTEMVLHESEAQRFQIHTARETPLAHVLARDENGWPVAVSDDEGWLEWGAGPARSDTGTSDGRRPAVWFENVAGRVYEAQRRLGSTLTVRELSRPYRGTISLAPRPERPHSPGLVEARPAETLYWREPRIPWPQIDAKTAPPLRRSADRHFKANLQTNEALWFSASGRGYSYCHESDLAVGGEESGGGGTPCARLAATRPIEGLVTGDAGEPIADAEILVDWQQDGAHPTVVRNRTRFRPHHSVVLLRSDSNGRFASDRIGVASIESPFSEAVFLRVARAGYVPVRGRGFEPLDGLLRVQLARSVPVTGRVFDSERQVPIVGAEVALGTFPSPLVLGPLPGEAQGGPPQTTTAPDGSFELRARPGGRGLLVRAGDHAPLTIRTLTVHDTGVDLGTIFLKPGFEIRGIVLDGAGRPVPGAQVRATGTPVEGAFGEDGRRRRSEQRFANPAQTESDHEGRFSLPGLGLDSVVDLHVSAIGFAPEVAERRMPENAEPLEVRLRKEAVVEGRVRIDNRPAAARISLRDAGLRHPGLHAASNEKGEYRFAGLHAGRYNVTIRPRQPGVDPSRTAIEAVSGDVVRLDVDLEQGTKSLSGRVTTGAGTGLGGVEVHAQGHRTMTAPDGSYLLSGLGSSRIDARATRAGWETLSDSIQISGPHGVLDFEFTKVPVEGYASWADDSPVANETLRFGPPPGDGGTTRTDSDGFFSVHLEPKEYIVAVGTASSDHQKLERLRVDGPTTDARIRFGRRLQIRGRVHGLIDSELSRLKVEAVNADDHRVAWGSVDASGRFGFDWVDTGVWNVIGTVGAGERRAQQEVRLTDQDIEIDLEFRLLFDLSGVVRLGGEPLRSTRVLLSPDLDWAGARYAWTLHDGTFRFTDLKRGNYQIGIGASIREVSVGGEEHLTIDFVGGQIGGLVRDRDTSLPRPGTEVLLWPGLVTRTEAESIDVLRRTFANGEGEFLFDHLPEGLWTVEVPALFFKSSAQVGPGSLSVLDVP